MLYFHPALTDTGIMNNTWNQGYTLPDQVFLTAAYWYALGKGEYSSIARFFSEDYVMMKRDNFVMMKRDNDTPSVPTIQEYFDKWIKDEY